MKQLNAMTDEELAMEYMSGNDYAFDKLLERYKEKVFKYIFSITKMYLPQLTDVSAETTIVNTQVKDSAVKLMNHLPELQREVVYMKYFEDKSFKEIASLTNVSINTSLGRMRYAILNMRRMAKKYNSL